MSTTLYGTGTHRVVYKAIDFATGLTVTAYFWNPSRTKSALQTFTEQSDGLYYLDYADFSPVGTYFAKFYEGGTGTIMGVFRVVAFVLQEGIALDNFEFLMVDSSDHITPKTGLTVASEINKDGSSFVGATNSATEISNGLYKINLTAAERTAKVITLKFTAVGADQRTVTIVSSL